MAIDDDQRECPFCAELIKKKAVKCRYCGEMLEGARPAASSGAVGLAQASGPGALADDQRECPFCAEIIKKKAIKCRHCGERVEAAMSDRQSTVAPPGGSTSTIQLAPGVAVKPPEALRQRIRASAESQPAEERRVVTVLFIDLMGFTALSRARDPEDVQGILNACVGAISECVYRYEGTVDKFLGDGVLALFGAPIAHEDDPQRALHCALAIQEAIENLPEARANALRYRIGIHTGVVLAGRLGSDLRMEYTVLGDTVNIASRLQNHCRPGQVLVSESTHARARPAFEFDTGDYYTLKGIPSPVKAYTVLGLRRTPEVDRRRERAVDLELVGRQIELQHILSCAERLASNRGQVVAIAGDAGVGKTRLLGELREDLRRRGIAVHQGCCLSYGRDFGYLPFQEILRGYFGCIEKQSAEQAIECIETKLGSDASLAATDLDLLLGLLGHPRTEEKPLAEQSPEQLAYLLERLFLLEARRNPLALFFEDVQWIDHSSQGILDYLVGRIKNVPILLCCTHREGFAHGWTSRTYFTQISLQELARDDSLQLVDRLLGRSRIPPDCLDLIIEKSGGNPFYLCELIQQLVAAGTLSRIDGVYQATQSLREVPIPDSVHAVIAARMDTLEELPRLALQVAAVIGRVFSLDLLREVIERNGDLAEALDRLVDMEFIQHNWEPGQPQFVFKHGLTQEVAYESLLLRHRADYHQRTAQAIERLHADNLAEWYETLARHYLAANNTEKAMAYLKRSGEKAVALYATDEAVGFFQRYLEIARAAEADKSAPDEICQVHVSLGEVYHLTGRPAEALEAYQAAAALAHEAAQAVPDSRAFDLTEARALCRMGRVHMRRGEHEAARGVIERARAVFARHRDEQGIALATNDMGVIAWNLGQLEQALEAFTQAREAAHRLGERRLEANAVSNMALVYLDHGDLDRSLSANLDALAIRRRRRDPRDVAISLNNVGIVYERLGELQKALESYQEALSLSREIHYVQGMTHPMTNIGQMYLAMGDLEAARRHLDETHDVAAGAQESYCHAMLHLFLAQVDLYQGQFQRALASFDEALRLTQTTGELQRELIVRLEQASALAFLGRWQQAVDLLEASHRAIRDHGFRELEAAAHLRLSDALTVGERFEEALEHARRASELTEAGAIAYQKGMCAKAEAFALAGLGRVEEAREAFRRALAFAVKRREAMTEILSSIGLARLLLDDPATETGDLHDLVDTLRGRIETGGFVAFGWWPEFLDGRRALNRRRPGRAAEALRRAIDRIERLAATLDEPADRDAYVQSPARRIVYNSLQHATRRASDGQRP